MNYDVQLFELISKEKIATDTFDFVLKNEKLSNLSKPGQFAHVLVDGKTLRRPISICDVTKDTIRIVFQIKGEGTRKLSETQEGEFLDVLTPLGKGFNIEKGKKYAFVGGGIGVPPMVYTAKQVKESIAIIGFRSKEYVILEDDLKEANCKVYVTTDDGTYGKQGFVTDVLKEVISDVDEVCACGPIPMLKAVSTICKENNTPCQVSLEERMGCGVGACLVCACKVNRGGEEDYLHVCKDGPVFNAEEVVW